MAERAFIPPTTSRLIAKRNGSSILRSAAVPKPVVLVDSREQLPLPLRQNHPNWIEGEKVGALPTADYSIEGMEDMIALERKSLGDLLGCIVTQRERFLSVCERLSAYRWRAIIIEASYEDLKSDWAGFRIPAEVHQNSVTGTLDAIEARFGIPIIYTSVNRALTTERAASWLSKHFTYWWLEQNGFGRVLIDSDNL